VASKKKLPTDSGPIKATQRQHDAASEPSAVPPRPATEADIAAAANTLISHLLFTAHAWQEHAMLIPTEDNREIASVLMALAASTGHYMRRVIANADGEMIPQPPTEALAWRRAAFMKSRGIVSNPLLTAEIGHQRLSIELSINEGDEREASAVVKDLAQMPINAPIRDHAPRLSSFGLYVTPAGLRQMLRGSELAALVREVHSGWVKCKRSAKWPGMNAEGRRRELVLSLFRTLGSPKPGNLYASQGMKTTRAHSRKRHRG